MNWSWTQTQDSPRPPSSCRLPGGHNQGPRRWLETLVLWFCKVPTHAFARVPCASLGVDFCLLAERLPRLLRTAPGWLGRSSNSPTPCGQGCRQVRPSCGKHGFRELTTARCEPSGWRTCMSAWDIFKRYNAPGRKMLFSPLYK